MYVINECIDAFMLTLLFVDMHETGVRRVDMHGTGEKRLDMHGAGVRRLDHACCRCEEIGKAWDRHE